MLKNRKQKTQYGSFSHKTTGSKKSRNFFIALAMLFILGGGFAWYKAKHKASDGSVASTVITTTTIPGWWYQQYFGYSICDQEVCKPETDIDHDGLTNLQEYYYHTDPKQAFTVKDKLNDGQLVAAGLDPSKPGEVTFEQVSDPSNLLGESLVFSSDIKKMLQESNDINSVPLPLVQDSEIKIINSEKEEDYKKYASDLQSAISKYFPSGGDATSVLKKGSDAEAESVALKAGALINDLKNIQVPVKFVTFQKYNISLFQLMPKIIPVPTAPSDAWFDEARQFLAITQKIDFERNRLSLTK